MFKVTVVDLFTDDNKNPVFKFSSYVHATQCIGMMTKQGYKVIVECDYQEGEANDE